MSLAPLAFLAPFAPLAFLAPFAPPATVVVVNPTWIWTQAAIVVFVVIGMVVAIVKLA